MENVEDKQFETKNCPTRTTKVHHITRACKASFWTTAESSQSKTRTVRAAKALHIPYRIYEARYKSTGKLQRFLIPHPWGIQTIVGCVVYDYDEAKDGRRTWDIRHRNDVKPIRKRQNSKKRE